MNWLMSVGVDVGIYQPWEMKNSNLIPKKGYIHVHSCEQSVRETRSKRARWVNSID